MIETDFSLFSLMCLPRLTFKPFTILLLPKLLLLIYLDLMGLMNPQKEIRTVQQIIEINFQTSQKHDSLNVP